MNMNGNLPQKKSYALSLNANLALIAELFLILMGGALAAFLHFKLRIPLNIPGHHGLEFMAIFTFIRLSSNIRYAATVATTGVGILMLFPGIGAGSPLHSIGYLLPGIILDLLYQVSRGRIRVLIIAAILAGICYMSIPFSRLTIYLASGYPYGAFIKFGIPYTMVSFLIFGMLGGILGYGLYKLKLMFNQNSNHLTHEESNQPDPDQ